MASERGRKIVNINSEMLYNAIQAKTSIRKLGPEIGYSEKTIRRALKEGVISVNLAISLSQYLGINLLNSSIPRIVDTGIRDETTNLNEQEVILLLKIARRNGLDWDGDVLRIYLNEKYGIAHVLRP